MRLPRTNKSTVEGLATGGIEPGRADNAALPWIETASGLPELSHPDSDSECRNIANRFTLPFHWRLLSDLQCFLEKVC